MTKIIIIFAIFSLGTTLAKPWAPYYGTDPPTDAPTEPPTELPTDPPTKPPSPTSPSTSAPTEPPPYNNHHKRAASYDGYGAPMPPQTPAPPPIVPTPMPPAPTPIVPTPPPIASTPATPPIASTPATPEPTTEDLIQVLTKKGNFKQLIEAITKSGLTDQLKTITTGLATIFAPNDNAFKKLPEGTTVESLTKEDLEKIISR